MGTRAALDVSLITVEAVFPCKLMVRVSIPSVKLSAAMGTETVAVPDMLIVVKPVSNPPVMSEDETPESV